MKNRKQTMQEYLLIKSNGEGYLNLKEIAKITHISSTRASRMMHPYPCLRTHARERRYFVGDIARALEDEMVVANS